MRVLERLEKGSKHHIKGIKPVYSVLSKLKLFEPVQRETILNAGRNLGLKRIGKI